MQNLKKDEERWCRTRTADQADQEAEGASVDVYYLQQGNNLLLSTDDDDNEDPIKVRVCNYSRIQTQG